MTSTVSVASARKVTNTRKALMLSCAAAAMAVGVANPQKARAQAFNGTMTSNPGTTRTITGSGTETITVNTNVSTTATINWTPDESGTGAISFLPSGNVATFTSQLGADFTVLNRVVPVQDASRAIRLDGSVLSEVNGATGGNVWFYSPGGIVVGSTAHFDVGGLLLTTSDLPNGFTTDSTSTFSASFGPASPTSKIEIESGAQINALLQNSYVALVAPRIEQRGDVLAGGSTAYVAAEQASLTFNQGLFDIQVSTGTTDANGIDHSGSTNWLATMPGQHRAYMVAVPKNQAMWMLLGGNVGADDVTQAVVENGQIVLSSGFNVTNLSGNTLFVGSGGTQSNLDINSGSYGSNVNARASGDISAVAETGDIDVAGNLNLYSLRSAGSGNVVVGADAGNVNVGGNLSLSSDAPTFQSRSEVYAWNGNQVNVTGNADIISWATGDGLTPGRAVIYASNGSVNIGGLANLYAAAPAFSANSETVSADNFGGDIEVTANSNGTITTGGMVLSAFANGQDNLGGGDGSAGDGNGGDISIWAESGGAITVNGNLTANADGIGGRMLDGSTAGGAGEGGWISVSVGDGDIAVTGDMFLSALGIGGSYEGEATPAIALGGLGQGGEVSVWLGGSGSIDVDGMTTLRAQGSGGHGQTGGAGIGGSAGIDGFDGSASFGDIDIDASGSGGNAAVGFGGNGGFGQGGVAYIEALAQTGNVEVPASAATITGGTAILNAGGFGGTGGAGDGGTVQAGAGGAGQGGVFNGELGSGGAFAAAQNPNASLTLGYVNLIADGVGGAGGTGGAGQAGGAGGAAVGGTAQAGSYAASGESVVQGAVTSFDFLRIQAAAHGGDGGSGPADSGDGGAAFGGSTFINAKGTVNIADGVEDYALAIGGDGANGGFAQGGYAIIRSFADSDLNIGGDVRTHVYASGGAGSTGSGGSAIGGNVDEGGAYGVTVEDGASITVGGWFEILADGWAGDGAVGGSGTGGVALVEAFGSGSFSAGSMSLSAHGTGGHGSNGGGAGQGGWAHIGAHTGGDINVIGAVALGADGVGGSVFNLDPQANGAGGSGTGGGGGQSLGGAGIFTDSSDSVVSIGGNLSLTAYGFGGNGAVGGAGLGGDAGIRSNAGAINIGGDLGFHAVGAGGNANIGFGGAGGFAQGGTAYIQAELSAGPSASISGGDVFLNVGAQGGVGGIGFVEGDFAQNAGSGGNAVGGTHTGPEGTGGAHVIADSRGAVLSLGNLDLYAGAEGGAGGVGVSNAFVSAASGHGGTATGGTVSAGTFRVDLENTDALAQVSFGNVTANASATGGAGGAGDVQGNGGAAYGGGHCGAVDTCGGIQVGARGDVDMGQAWFGALATGGAGNIGGNAVGGDVTVVLRPNGSLTSTSFFTLDTSATGGSGVSAGGNGDAGWGGFDINGGSFSATGVQVFANGFGGTGLVGGNGTGGDAMLLIGASGGSVTTTNAFGLHADGNGGTGSDNPEGTGGAGGAAQGGTAAAEVAALGSVNVGSLNLQSSAFAGNGGDGVDGGDGGNGTAGSSTITLHGGSSLTAGTILNFSRGLAGDGGNGTTGLGGDGGQAQGGTSLLTVNAGATLTAAEYHGSANGPSGYDLDQNQNLVSTGGNGGTGGSGVGAGGSGTSGVVGANIGGTANVSGDFIATAFARGGDGSTGGAATGGDSSIVVDGTLSVGGRLQSTTQAVGGQGASNGGAATGGTSSITTTGTVTAGDIWVGSNATGGHGTQNGGTALGGNSSLLMNGGTLAVTQGILVQANATGGAATTGAGGNAEAGITRLLVSGSAATSGTVGVEAKASGGAGGSAGGAATGGDARLRVTGALSGVNLAADASAIGGAASNGTGGTGSGGLARIVGAEEGSILTTGTTTVHADGTGGAGTAGGGDGFGTDASVWSDTGASVDLGSSTTVTAKGTGGASSNDTGGDGTGGYARVRAFEGASLAASNVTVDASGTGGAGINGGDGSGGQNIEDWNGAVVDATLPGAVLALTGQTTIVANGTGGAGSGTGTGGTGTGGSAILKATNGGSATLANTWLSANGTGGGSLGGNGGVGQGGSSSFYIGEGDVLVTGGLTMDAYAWGGDGITGGNAHGGFATISTGQAGTLDFDVVGATNLKTIAYAGAGSSVGGNGWGGESSITIDSALADISFGSVTLDSGTFAGDGMAGTGGHGGHGEGGPSTVTVTAGTMRTGTLSLVSGGWGGDGGSLAGGAGGDGGDGHGGETSLTVGGSLYSSSVVLWSRGNGGIGGAGATAGAGGDARGVAGTATVLAGGLLDTNYLSINSDAFAGSGNSGGTAYGGEAALTVAGAANIDTIVLVSSANGGAASNGNGGDAWGGGSSLSVSGTLFAATVGLTGDAFGGHSTNGVGGYAYGGLAELAASGNVTVTGETFLSAEGEGGDGSTQGGDGWGGDAGLWADSGATVDLGTVTNVEAEGTGGNASNGAGGLGLGGHAHVHAYSNSTVIANDLTVAASAEGGSGNSGGSAYGGYPTEGDAGAIVEASGPGSVLTLTGLTTIESNGEAGGGAGAEGVGGYAALRAVGGSISGAGAIMDANGTTYGGELRLIAEGFNGSGGGTITLTSLTATANGGAAAGDVLFDVADGSSASLGIASLTSTGGGLPGAGEDGIELDILGELSAAELTLTSSDDISISTYASGQILVDGAIDANSLSVVRLVDDGGSALIQSSTLDLTGSDIQFNANVQAVDILLTLPGDYAIGNLPAASNSLTINAGGNLSAAEDVFYDGSLSLDAGGNLTGSDFLALGSLTLNAGGSLSVGDLTASGGVAAGAGGNLTVGNVLSGYTPPQIGFTALAVVATGEDVILSSGGDMQAGTIQSAGNIMLDAVGTMTTGDLTAVADIAASSGGSMDLGIVTAANVFLTAGSWLSVDGVDATAAVEIDGEEDVMLGDVLAGDSILLSAGGIADLLGLVSAPEITVTSREIAIADLGSLGEAGVTTLLTLNALSDGSPVVIGGDEPVSEGQYHLSPEGDINSEAVVFNALAATEGGAAPDVIIRQLDIEGSLTADGGVSSVTLNTGGSVLVEGALTFVDAAATDVLAINAGETIQVNTDTGSIAMSNGEDLSGILELTAHDIWVAEGDVLAQLNSNPDFAGRDEALGTNNGPANPAGYLQAGELTVTMLGSSFMVQNTGTDTEPAGLTVGDGGLTVVNQGSTPATVIIYGRQAKSDGTVNSGEAFFEEVQFAGNNDFTQDSNVNGCDVGGGCTPDAPPEVIPGVENILGPIGLMNSPSSISSSDGGPSDGGSEEESEEETEEEGDDGQAGVDASVGLINTGPVSLEVPIDQPVTSGSDGLFIGGPGGN